MPQPVQTTPGVVDTFSNSFEVEALTNAMAATYRPADGDMILPLDQPDFVAVTPQTTGNRAWETDLSKSPGGAVAFADLREMPAVASFTYKDTETPPASVTCRLVGTSTVSITLSLQGTWTHTANRKNSLYRGVFSAADFTTAGVAAGNLSSAKVQYEYVPIGTGTAIFAGALGIAGKSASETGATGPAGGDLSGTYPNPTVVKIQTVPVDSTAPISGQILTYDGSKWVAGSGIDGLAWKQPVRAATTGNITLSGLQTIDGVSLAASDRVLVKDQTDAKENGIYSAETGAWVRKPDGDTGTELDSAAVFVSEGTANEGAGYVQTTDSVVIGTSNIVWQQFNGLGAITAGTGLTKAGNVLDVGANADGSIVVNADDVQVGVLATDAQHGVRGGGTQHAVATTTVNGFMSGADKTKLDGINAANIPTTDEKAGLGASTASAANPVVTEDRLPEDLVFFAG